MEDAVRRLLEHFRTAGVALNPGATRSALDRFEEAQGLQIPRALAELLLVGNGMQDGMDSNGFRVWSLEEIIPLDQSFCADPTQSRPSYLVFLDYMAGTHGYAVEVGPGGESGDVLLADGSASRRVAPSLTNFWTMFVENPLTLIQALERGTSAEMAAVREFQAMQQSGAVAQIRAAFEAGGAGRLADAFSLPIRAFRRLA